MKTRKSKVFPIIITILLIFIIIYLFSSIKQPYIECSNEKITDANILVRENLKTTLDSNKIEKIELTKTIILQEKYKDNYEKYLNSIEYSLKKAYQYLGKKVTIMKENDRIIVKIIIDKNETIILNDINFYENNGLQIEIESNTKNSNIVALSIKDKYTEGELLTRMKNNGYRCK